MMTELANTLKMFATVFHYYGLANKPDANHEILKVQWSREFMRSCHMNIEIQGNPNSIPNSAFVVSNHISYMDIPLLMSFIPNSAFVSKAEVIKWPIIGPATIKAGTIFVQRDSHNSRKAVMDSMRTAALRDKKRIVIFPSGTTSIKPSKQWKRGIFQLAFETGIPVQPLRITYTPLRKVAYIDDDALCFHLMKMTRPEMNQAKVEFGELTQIKDVLADTERVRRWSEGHLNSEAV